MEILVVDLGLTGPPGTSCPVIENNIRIGTGQISAGAITFSFSLDADIPDEERNQIVGGLKRRMVKADYHSNCEVPRRDGTVETVAGAVFLH